MKGMQITSLEDLSAARDQKRAVSCHGWSMGARPAAFVMNLSGEIILRMIRGGLFIHIPEKRRKIPLIKPNVR